MKFAIGFINFYENDLTIEIHEGDTWKEAARKHSRISDDTIESFDDDLEKAKHDAFDIDTMIDAKVIE